MKTGRADLDQRIKISSVPQGEPTFFFRGHDINAPPALRAYAALNAEAGAPLAVVEQVLQQADAMQAWPVKRLVDAGHLNAEEQKDLVAQLGRRAWNFGVDHIPTEQDLLIRQLGYDDARGKCRRLRGLIELALEVLLDPDRDDRIAHELLRQAAGEARGLG